MATNNYNQMSTETYKIVNNKLVGKCDKKEALIQALYLLLNIERFDYYIYSWDYGIQIKDLIGSQMNYVIAVTKKRITDAIMVDSRVTSVRDFSYEKSGNSLHYTFTVDSIYGAVKLEKEVSYE